jgi:hypothetical protein
MPKSRKNGDRHNQLPLRRLDNTEKMPLVIHSVTVTHRGSTTLSHAVAMTSHRVDMSPLIFRHPAIMLPLASADNWL